MFTNKKCKRCGKPSNGFDLCPECAEEWTFLLLKPEDPDIYIYDGDIGMCDDCICADCSKKKRCPIMNS